MNSSVVIGADIGGSHISCGLFDLLTGDRIQGGQVHAAVDSSAGAAEILSVWLRALEESRAAAEGRPLAGVGFAMPGPFDYPGGISLIRGLGKYDSLFGVNIRTEVQSGLGLTGHTPVLFANDAECFLLGEAWRGAISGARTAIGLTIGTGFGSAFLRDGEVATEGTGVPENGWLYNAPFRGGIAEDWFSGRGLTRLYTGKASATQAITAREIATRAGAGEQHALEVLAEFGALLGEFLLPLLRDFRPDAIVVGGSVSRAWEFFAPSLGKVLCHGEHEFLLRPSALFEEAALVGAASLPRRAVSTINQKDS